MERPYLSFTFLSIVNTSWASPSLSLLAIASVILMSPPFVSSFNSLIRSTLAAAIPLIVCTERPELNSGFAFGSDIALRIALPLATRSGSNLVFILAPFTPARADSISSTSATIFIACFFSASEADFIVPRDFLAASSACFLNVVFLSNITSATSLALRLPILPEMYPVAAPKVPSATAPTVESKIKSFAVYSGPTPSSSLVSPCCLP